MAICNACGIETVRIAKKNGIEYCLICSDYFQGDKKMDNVDIDYDNIDVKYDDEEVLDETDFDFEDLTDEELEEF